MRSIEEMLDYLASIGRPRLSRMDDGTWYAKLELPAPNGVVAEVASDFNHATHREALEAVLERLEGLSRTVASAARQPPSALGFWR